MLRRWSDNAALIRSSTPDLIPSWTEQVCRPCGQSGARWFYKLFMKLFNFKTKILFWLISSVQSRVSLFTERRLSPDKLNPHMIHSPGPGGLQSANGPLVPQLTEHSSLMKHCSIKKKKKTFRSFQINPLSLPWKSISFNTRQNYNDATNSLILFFKSVKAREQHTLKLQHFRKSSEPTNTHVMVLTN